MIVSGHIPATTAVPVPLSVDRVTCSHIGAAESIDVWLTSQVGATVAGPGRRGRPRQLSSFTGTVTDAERQILRQFLSAGARTGRGHCDGHRP